MSTDQNLSAAEDLESYGAGADNIADVEYDDEDYDYDYDPPMPYDYRQQWADNPVEWAVLYAANLIRQFECGPDFFSNLDASVIEDWVFSDYPVLLETLRSDDSLAEFRSGLSQHCRMLKGAALLANEILLRRHGLLSPLPALSPECEEFFPGWVSKIETKPEWTWHAQLPGAVAELRGKWANEEFFNSHHSDEIVPHSLISRGESPVETCEDRQSITAHVLERNDFPLTLKFSTQERFAFFIRLPADVNIETLTKYNQTALAVHERESDGVSVWDLSLGNGVLSIPLLEHEAILTRFRARLPVIYERDGELLVVEYDWNPLAFGHQYIGMAKIWPPAEGATAGLRLVTKLPPEAMRIERAYPMTRADYDAALGIKPLHVPESDDDDIIPF